MSRLSIQAAIRYREQCAPDAGIVLAGESDPRIPLPATSELMRDLAVKDGVPENSIKILDSAEKLANSTRMQVGLFADYFLRGEGQGQNVAFMGWDYHLTRVRNDAASRGLSGPGINFTAVESILP